MVARIPGSHGHWAEHQVFDAFHNLTVGLALFARGDPFWIRLERIPFPFPFGQRFPFQNLIEGGV